MRFQLPGLESVFTKNYFENFDESTISIQLTFSKKSPPKPRLPDQPLHFLSFVESTIESGYLSCNTRGKVNNNKKVARGGIPMVSANAVRSDLLASPRIFARTTYGRKTYGCLWLGRPTMLHRGRCIQSNLRNK